MLPNISIQLLTSEGFQGNMKQNQYYYCSFIEAEHIENLSNYAQNELRIWTSRASNIIWLIMVSLSSSWIKHG